MTASTGHADAVLAALDAAGPPPVPMPKPPPYAMKRCEEALVKTHDDLRACEADLFSCQTELIGARRALKRAETKLARHAAARTPEALALRVLRVDVYTWHVPSDTAPGGRRVVIYMPRVECYSCDCEHNIHRGDCRHVQAVSLFNRAQAQQEQTA